LLDSYDGFDTGGAETILGRLKNPIDIDELAVRERFCGAGSK